jgi:uncharacterized membrane protein
MIYYLFQQNPDFAQFMNVAFQPLFLIIAVLNYIVNRKSASEISDIVNFGMMVIASIMFIPWLICMILSSR